TRSPEPRARLARRALRPAGQPSREAGRPPDPTRSRIAPAPPHAGDRGCAEHRHGPLAIARDGPGARAGGRRPVPPAERILVGDVSRPASRPAGVVTPRARGGRMASPRDPRFAGGYCGLRAPPRLPARGRRAWPPRAGGSHRRSLRPVSRVPPAVDRALGGRGGRVVAGRAVAAGRRAGGPAASGPRGGGGGAGPPPPRARRSGPPPARGVL